MKVTINIPAPTYSKFTKEAVKAMIGQDFRAKHEEKDVGLGKILAAKVINDGKAIEATIEWPVELPVSIKGF